MRPLKAALEFGYRGADLIPNIVVWPALHWTTSSASSRHLFAGVVELATCSFHARQGDRLRRFLWLYGVRL